MVPGIHHFTYSNFTRSVNAVAWSPDGRYLAAVGSDMRVRIWDVITWQLIDVPCDSNVSWKFPDDLLLIAHHMQMRWRSGQEYHWFVLKWSPDGHHLVSGFFFWAMEVRSMPGFVGKEQIREIPAWPRITNAGGIEEFSIKEGASQDLLLSKDRGKDLLEVLSMEHAPERKRMAVGRRKNVVEVWTDDLEEVVCSYRRHTGGIVAVMWSPDRQTIASGGYDLSIRIWNAETGEDYCVCTGHQDTVLDVCWSPDGRHLASGSWDRTVRVWDVSTGTCTSVYKGHNGPVNSIAWSPDGRYIASGSWDHTMQVWEPL